jgi:hypothetical protein
VRGDVATGLADRSLLPSRFGGISARDLPGSQPVTPATATSAWGNIETGSCAFGGLEATASFADSATGFGLFLALLLASSNLVEFSAKRKLAI